MYENNKPIIIELNMHKIAKVNVWLTVILLALFIVTNSVIHQRFPALFSFLDFLYFIVGYCILIVLHEVFHLIGFMIFGKVAYRDLDYGLNLKLGVAYATTKKVLTNSAMKKALLLPFWTTGVLPTFIGFYLDNFLLVSLGAFLIAGAVGDFHMYKELKKFPNNVLVKDDPRLPKLYVYEQS